MKYFILLCMKEVAHLNIIMLDMSDYVVFNTLFRTSFMLVSQEDLS